MAAHRMTLKYTSLVLVLAMVLSGVPVFAEEPAGGMTLQELKDKYPRARFVQVSLQEFEQIYSNYPGRSIVLVESTNNAGFQEVDVQDIELAKTNLAPASILLIEPEQAQPDVSKPSVRSRTSVRQQHDSCIGLDVFGDIDVGSDEVAVVIFVLVGVVVVAYDHAQHFGKLPLFEDLLADLLVIEAHDLSLGVLAGVLLSGIFFAGKVRRCAGNAGQVLAAGVVAVCGCDVARIQSE